ncbi:hypothetical protein [Neorhodopirellula lusitana]|uniref:hypothetical protein n=1 Tax=Neorhodopirellula lusitana TaxID=445327 RepID=UPI003850C0FE
MNEVETEIDVQKTSEQSGTDRVLILILRAAAFLCFAGWTWVHYYWEAPYGILLWQDATFEFASEQGVSWDEFIGTGTNDGWLQTWVSRITWLYFAFTIMTVTVRSKSYLQMAALIGGSGLLTVLSYAKYVASQRQLPMFLEHGGQMLAPILLVTALLFGARHRATLVVAMVALVMTFVGHGCYAVGWWPTPGNFYGMISLSLGVQYETANVMLGVFGILDFIVCIAIFLPYVRRWAIWYAVVWGFLTAVARPVAGMSMSLNYWGADQYIHEAVLRAPHFLIPLYLAILWRRHLSATPTLAKPIPPSIVSTDAVPAASA